MVNKNNRLLRITLRGRRKGKYTYPVTIALTQTQIEYLHRQPNASALIRKILDDLIASEQVTEDKFGVISLNVQLNELEKKLGNLKNERFRYLWENELQWQHVTGADDGRYIVWADEDNSIPKPLDTEDAKVAFRVLQGYDEAIKALEEQIKEVKKKIIES